MEESTSERTITKLTNYTYEAATVLIKFDPEAERKLAGNKKSSI